MRVLRWKGEWDVISTVFFDVGSTLMYACPSVPEAFALAAREHGFNLSVRDVVPFMDEVDRFYEQEYLRDGDFWCSHERSVMIWKDMYGILARRTGLGEHAALLAEATHAKYRTAAFWALYDDVVPCLRTLKLSGHRLGVISNWDAGLEALLREVGLLPYFDVVVASAAVGYRKPDPVVFELALERMGARPEETAHVGDLPEADGAAAAEDIMPVIIDRKRIHRSSGLTCIDTLTDLPAVLEGC